MKRIIALTLVTFLFGGLVTAQEQLSKKQQADLLFNRYEYYNAARLYTSLADKKKPDVKILERLAACYRIMNVYPEAEKWYAKAVADPKADLLSHYYYAEVLLRNQQFEKAKTEYALYGTKSGKTEETALKIASCDSAALWMKQPSRYTVQNVASLNSKYADWGLNYTGKSNLVFTSDRISDELGKTNDTYQWTGNPWLKLFMATESNVVTDELAIIGKEHSAFKTDYHVGPMVVNNTQDTAYVTITTRIDALKIPVDQLQKKGDERLYTRRLELVIVVKKDGRWAYYKHFPYNDVKAFSVGHAALSKNGNILYFTSDRPGGFGKTDIWYCEKQPDGKWGVPVNCGAEINTAQEEAFPTTGAVAGELYFSSRGRIGMGGYDIYSAKGEKNQWSKAQNLKYPVNTTSDDFYLVSNDGISGYFSSDREGGKGSDDIYSFTYQAPVIDKPVVVVEPVVEVPKKSPFIPGKSYVMDKIYYNFNKSDIRPDAAKELDKLVAVLNEYPTIKIELSSHTDSRGNDAYNLGLSQRRAESAVGYLIAKGIAAERLTAKGYGETRLLNQCANGVQCTEAQHQLNRRTEFKVIE